MLEMYVHIIRVLLAKISSSYLFVLGTNLRAFFLKKNLNAHLDLLSIPQLGRKRQKRSGGIIGCKYKTSSWHLDGFPEGSLIGSTL